MQVMDIVNRALMKSGAVPSFNPDEVPEDMQQRAADVLRHEIIPDLNCDRTIDITEIVKPYKPEFGVIDLTTPPLDYPAQQYGPVPQPWSWFTSRTVDAGLGHLVFANLMDWLEQRGLLVINDRQTYSDIEFGSEWDTDQFGKQRDISIWTADFKLIELKLNRDGGATFSNLYSRQGETIEQFRDRLTSRVFNVPFAPMRVTDVFRLTTGEEFKYVHASEMVSAEYRHATYIYTVEDYMGTLRLRFTVNNGDQPVLLVLPVPITVRNTYEEPNPWQGEIVAPEKFRSFLLNTLAWRMAVEYGIATAPDMQKLAEKSYMNLVKNLTKQQHPQDISRKIFNYLERGRNWNGNGYCGGRYGR